MRIQDTFNSFQNHTFMRFLNYTPVCAFFLTGNFLMSREYQAKVDPSNEILYHKTRLVRFMLRLQVSHEERGEDS